MNPQKSVVVTWPDEGEPAIWFGGQLTAPEREAALKAIASALFRDIRRHRKAAQS